MNIRTVRYRGAPRCLLLAVAALLSMTAVHAQPDSASAKPMPAVWQAYELDFHYFASTTYYSCSGMENRLEQILRELGADKDVRATVTGCFGPADIGNMLGANIRVRMPLLATEAQAQSFPAVSQLVVFKSGSSGDIGSGDCELLEQVRDQLLPALKLQAVKDDLRCVPGQASFPGRSLQVMALLPQPSSK